MSPIAVRQLSKRRYTGAFGGGGHNSGMESDGEGPVSRSFNQKPIDQSIFNSLSHSKMVVSLTGIMKILYLKIYTSLLYRNLLYKYFLSFSS